MVYSNTIEWLQQMGQALLEAKDVGWNLAPAPADLALQINSLVGATDVEDGVVEQAYFVGDDSLPDLHHGSDCILWCQ